MTCETDLWSTPMPKLLKRRIFALGAAVYTCPMHPAVRHSGPGSCPLCGITLEPATQTRQPNEDPELADLQRRVLWTLPLTLAVAFLAMAGQHLAWPDIGVQAGLHSG